MQTLLQPFEVLLITRFSPHIDPATVDDILSIETREFRNCIGKPFYTELKEDLVDYSGEPEYDNTENYVIDDIVLFEGLYYICIANIDGELPTNTTYWKLAPKFTTDAFNELWNVGFLGRYLALNVLFMSASTWATPVKANGFVELDGDGYKTAGDKFVERGLGTIQRNINDALGNLSEWINDNNTNGIYNNATILIKPNTCGCGCCKSCLERKQAINSGSVWA